MLKKVSLILLSSVFVFQANLYAFHTTTHTTTYVPQAPPNNIKVGSLYYDGSVSGIRKYMKSLIKSDYKMYQELDPLVRKLENRQLLGWVSTIGLGSIGATLMIGSFTFLAKEETIDIGYGLTVTETTYNDPALYVGAGLGIVAVLTLYLVFPGRGDIMDFINQHNRLNRENPMEFQLGLDIQPDKQFVKLIYNF